MGALYVPILDSSSPSGGNLFSVTCEKQESVYPWSRFNGVSGNTVPFFNEKLRAFFAQDTFSFKILNKNETEPHRRAFVNFSERVTSISLGLFCAAYKTAKNRALRENYDSITVTGDFRVVDGKVQLVKVKDIEEKFKLVQNYAGRNANQKHLFLYISSEDVIPEGLQDNNIFVMRYDSSNVIECMFAEIFELSDLQKHKLEFLHQKKNEYVESISFIKWKKELVEPYCGGLVLCGGQDCGKTIAAANFCKYMISTYTVDELIWITIVKPYNFLEQLRKSIFFDIKKYFYDQFSQLDKLLENKKKTCLIIDNIECDVLEDILFFIKKNYKSAVDNNLLKIVITSQKNCEDRNLLSDLKLIGKNCERLIEHEDFKYIVYSAFENMDIPPQSLKGFKENQKKLFELLSERCFDGEEAFPGRVSKSVASILEIGIDAYIVRCSQEKLRAVSKKMQQVRIDFEILDSISQWTLLAFIGVNEFKKKLDVKQICKKINAEIFNRKVENAFISEQNIIDAVRKLLRKDWIHESKANTDIFYVKTDTIDYCVFSDCEKDEINKNIVLARDALIPLNIKIKHAIQNDKFEIFERLIKNFSDKKDINEFLIRCIEYDRGINYLKIIVEKGIDPEYLDGDGVSAIDVVWCRDTDMEILDYLLKNGFKLRTKIPVPIDRRDVLGVGDYVSPLFLACDKMNIQHLRYILRHHLYDDINAYVFKGIFTILHYLTIIGESVEIVDLVVKAGADISLKTTSGFSLLNCAVLNENHPEFLEYILNEHLYDDIDAKDNYGDTALQYAVRKSSNSKLISLLIAHGADRSAITSRGETLLHLAAHNKKCAILEYILKNNYYTNIDECGKNKNTALFKAQNLEAFKLLLEHGANPKVITSKGNTILHAAVLSDRKEIVEYILKHLPMVDPAQKNLEEKTAAELASSDDIKKLF